MAGTLINVIAVIVGSGIGLLVGHRLTEKIQDSVVGALGLVVLTIGMQNAFKSGNIIIPLLSLAFGAIIGELLDIDNAFKRLGGWIQTRAAGTLSQEDTTAQGRARFINAFVTASLVFVIGPLAILGPIQNGINAGDIQLLVIKSILDFFAAMAFAASLGIGVMFSALPVFVYQVLFALIGMIFAGMLTSGTGGQTAIGATNPYILELTATGGLILLGLGFILLNIKQLRVANYLPALLIAPLLVLLVQVVGLNIPL